MSKGIPVKNIYYMLCYAWNLLNETEKVKSSEVIGVDAYNLFARVMVSGLEKLIKRGIGRGYSLVEDDTQVIRGKVDFAFSIKRQTMRHLRLNCHYEVMNHDTLFNRVIKATISNLLRYRDLHDNNREALTKIQRFFTEINDIKLTQNLFSNIHFHKGNGHYEMLIRICEMVYRNSAIDESTGQILFRDFERDKRLWELFELFVFNFYKRHLGHNCRVSHGTQVAWALDGAGQNVTHLPDMITDTVLENRERRLIIDTKYYAEAMVGRYEDSRKLRSQHLYQIYAYVHNSANTAMLGQRVDGMLLYPRVDGDVDCDYSIQGHRISVKMVNLNDGWEGIQQRLLDIVGF